jgi:hypothetical protein
MCVNWAGASDWSSFVLDTQRPRVTTPALPNNSVSINGVLFEPVCCVLDC